jgi:nucleotide-binding universal stress UspA family protein
MFPPKKVLFPVDFSDRCSAAARMVINFAERFQPEVTLLYAVEPITIGFEYAYDALTPSEQLLNTFLVEEFKHLPVKRVLLQGDAAHEITNYAHRETVDLIMLPTHGYGRFRRFLLGSVAAKVLHDAMCPVWTSVHTEEIGPPEKINFKNVVCAIDLGPQSCQTLRWAAKFAEIVDAQLTVAHAVPTAKDVPDFYTDQDFKNDLLHQAREKIDQLQQSLGMRAQVSVVPDEAPAGVRGCVEASNADLLVIGRSAQDGLLGRLRTNAYAIIRQSPCPVVSV